MPSITDNDDFAIYWVLDDDAIECTACDPEAGEPQDWPAWSDQDRWTYIDEPATEPAAADVAWLNANPTLPPIAGGSPEPFEPSDADWDDIHAARYGIDDDDIQAGGLAVG